MIPPERARRLSLLRLAGLLLLATCRASPEAAPGDARALARAVHDLLAKHRPYALLLSTTSATRPCLGAVEPDTLTVKSLSCGESRDHAAFLRQAAKLGPLLRTALATDSSVALRHAAGLLDLAAGSHDLNAITRASLRLDAAAASDRDNALLLRDAATAHAITAGLAQDAGDLLRALDLIERAAAQDSADPTIRFNRALLLERLGLVGEASSAWERTSAAPTIRAEATAHLEAQRDLDRRAGGRQRLERAMGASPAADSLLLRMRREEPGALREFALDAALPAWGEAILRNDSAQALTYLTLAERIGVILAGSGDSTVSAAVRQIRQGTGQLRLATATAAYGKARRRFDRGEFEAAAPDLHESFVLLRDEQPVALWGWPAIYLGVAELYAKNYPRADSLLTAVVRATQASPLLTERGRALWGWGLSLARQDRPQAAIDRYREAIRLFARAGERSNVGSLESQLADMYALTGDFERASAAKLRAAQGFLGHRGLGTLQGFLQAFAAFEQRAGRPHGALAMLREAARVSRRTGRAKDIPEALTRLAGGELQVGDSAAARAHILEARATLEGVTSPLMRAAEEAELARVEARLATRSEALAQVTRAVEYYERQRIPFDLAPTLVQRADTRLALGDSAGAEHDLDQALTLVQRRAAQLDALSAAAARAVERGVLERRVAIHLSRGDSTGALEQLGQAGWRASRGVALSTLPARLGPDDAVIAYAALPDQLMIWVVTDQGITTRVVSIGASKLADEVARFTSVLRRAGDAEIVFREAESLYRILLDPVQGFIRGKSHLAIVPDPLLGALPLGALRNPANTHFLVEDHALQHAFGIWEAVDGLTSRSQAVQDKILLVGDPAFDRVRNSELRPLNHAQEELDNLKLLYPAATSLTGSAATSSALIERLPEANLFHFGGHAVATAGATRGSRLVLTPSSEPGDDGWLTGDQIARLPLGRLQLVVLSACETLSQAGADTYRLDGLAEAFLAAGARSVVGSLWQVDDERVARLMIRFHQALGAGESPAAALRTAQLALLEAPGDPVASLRTWASFRYITR